MKRFTSILVIAIGLVTSAQAAETMSQTQARDTLPPTIQDMLKWKKTTLSKYEQVIYLDSDKRPITEATFNQRVVDDRRAFNMQTDTAAPKKIVIRLLSDAEQMAAQAVQK